MTRVAAHYIERGDGSALTAGAREYETLRLAAAGLNVDNIARVMGIHRCTINTYLYRWMQRTGAHNRAMLAMWAMQMGIVAPADIWVIWEQHAPQLAAWRQAGVGK